MSKVELECPSCGGRTDLGDITCPQCGVNLKSGEAFETRVQKAKGKATHPEHFSGRIYAVVIIGFTAFAFAGFMYHRAVEKAITEVPHMYGNVVLIMQEAEDQLALAQYASETGDTKTAGENRDAAVKRLEELKKYLEEKAVEMKRRTGGKPRYEGGRMVKEEQISKETRKVTIRQYKNLVTKIDRLLAEVASS